MGGVGFGFGAAAGQLLFGILMMGIVFGGLYLYKKTKKSTAAYAYSTQMRYR